MGRKANKNDKSVDGNGINKVGVNNVEDDIINSIDNTVFSKTDETGKIIKYEKVTCELSARIIQGDSKCVVNSKSVNTTCRECNLKEKIDRLLNPVPVEPISKELLDIDKYGNGSKRARKPVVPPLTLEEKLVKEFDYTDAQTEEERNAFRRRKCVSKPVLKHDEELAIKFSEEIESDCVLYILLDRQARKHKKSVEEYVKQLLAIAIHRVKF